MCQVRSCQKPKYLLGWGSSPEVHPDTDAETPPATVGEEGPPENVFKQIKQFIQH